MLFLSLRESHLDGGARELAPVAEQQLDVLSETAGIVIAHGASVAESFQDGVGLEDPLLDRAQLVAVSGGISEDGEVLSEVKRKEANRRETTRNGTTRNATNRIESKRNDPKRNKKPRNETKQNETRRNKRAEFNLGERVEMPITHGRPRCVRVHCCVNARVGAVAGALPRQERDQHLAAYCYYAAVHLNYFTILADSAYRKYFLFHLEVLFFSSSGRNGIFL